MTLHEIITIIGLFIGLCAVDYLVCSRSTQKQDRLARDNTQKNKQVENSEI